MHTHIHVHTPACPPACLLACPSVIHMLPRCRLLPPPPLPPVADMSAADSIDSHLVRVPFEALKRAAKDRKAAIDEASAALECAGVLPRAAADDAGMTDATPPSSREEHLSSLDELLGKVWGREPVVGRGCGEGGGASSLAGHFGFLWEGDPYGNFLGAGLGFRG
eukprot:365276-Chlamydomonas_euryale.AAC.18